MGNIRVFIVDDSAVIRKIFTQGINDAEGMEVVGTAVDPYHARDQIVKLKPDVITLDIEMPRMDGLTFLKKLMKHFPIPTLIVSSVSEKGSRNALQSFALGAIDVVSKQNNAYSGREVMGELVKKIRIASRVNMKRYLEKLNHDRKDYQKQNFTITTTKKVILIGSSTGGAEALRKILPMFPKSSPGILIVQHMPAGFTKSFSKSLDSECDCDVKEAESGDRVVNGKIFIAPGDYHLKLKREGATYSIGLGQGPRVCYQRPAADVLFQSASLAAGANAVGIVLTGMGSDGASGISAMKLAGGLTVAQDEETSIVFGMPKSAIETGNVDHVLPLHKIPIKVLELCS
jgi:two-component system, chemotaxis family, protein-glutamate methylesterase/glutaminase